MIPFWKQLEQRASSCPPSIPTKSSRNNKLSAIPMGMPFKSQNMTQGAELSSARKVYRSDSGGGAGWYSQSSVSAIRKVTAIGKGLLQTDVHSTAKGDRNIARSHLRRCRSGGSIAPKKKGAIGTRFRGGGCC